MHVYVDAFWEKDSPRTPDNYVITGLSTNENNLRVHLDYQQQAQGPKTPRPITVHFKKRPSSSVLEVGMWYLL